jgi:hypothetical protein
MFMEISVDKLVSIYIKMRDERDKLKKEMELKINEIDEQMKVVSNQLLDVCKENGVDSFRTPFGTAYRTLKSRFWTNDWEQFHKFMKEHDALELLERRIHQTNMKQFLEENPDTHPAGLQVEKEYAITVRRK